MTQKLAIVLSGGGNKCGAMVGMLRALSEVHGIREPDIIVASSGSAGPAFFYLAGRFDDMYDWPRLFASRKFVWLLRLWRIMDIDYLVDGILRVQAPRLGSEIAHTKTRVRVATTDVSTGETRWFDNRRLPDSLLIKKATCAVPGVYGKEVVIDGIRYIDGSFSNTLEDSVRRAFAEGAEKVIVFDTQSRYMGTLAGWALRVLSVRQGHEVRAIVRRYVAREERLIENSERVLVCRPERLAIRYALDTTRSHTRRGIEQGYAAVTSLPVSQFIG